MTTPQIRFATLQDIPQLIKLRIGMQHELYGPSEPARLERYAEELREYFARTLADGSYHSAVADADGTLVSGNGMVVFKKPPSVKGGSGGIGYISNVYTFPEWRGRGIAGRLMELLIAHGRETGLDLLHLGATDAGIGVYERVGFKSTRYPQLELRY